MAMTLRAFVLLAILAFPIFVSAQASSDDIVRNYIIEKLQPHVVSNAIEQAEESGQDRDDNKAAAERALGPIVDCLMREVELLAAANNIEQPHVYRDVGFCSGLGI